MHSALSSQLQPHHHHHRILHRYLHAFTILWNIWNTSLEKPLPGSSPTFIHLRNFPHEAHSHSNSHSSSSSSFRTSTLVSITALNCREVMFWNTLQLCSQSQMSHLCLSTVFWLMKQNSWNISSYNEMRMLSISD